MTHKPNAKTRKLVIENTECGIPQATIAMAMGICLNTLKKNYAEELATARIERQKALVNKHYNAGLNDDDPQAARCREYLLNTLHGFKVIEGRELSGPDGEAIKHELGASDVLKAKLKAMSPESKDQ